MQRTTQKVSGIKVSITGVVQGVGFRPTAYRIAKTMGLNGFVRNNGDAVEIFFVKLDNTKVFKKKLQANLSDNCEIKTWTEQTSEYSNLDTFKILPSLSSKSFYSIPSDLNTCSKCINEMYNPNSHFYLYPYISCGNCGPRYSILKRMPYDRENTSLQDFPLCETCNDTYHDDTNERFHIQGFTCENTGPTIWLTSASGTIKSANNIQDTIKLTQSLLKAGSIVAIKGLGGFQLLCDATNENAIRTLRTRKQRPHKALAVMARHPSLVNVSDTLKPYWLASSGPIVPGDPLTATLNQSLIAPDLDQIGFLLPTTGLHHLLFALNQEDPSLDFLIATSGNLHGAPIIKENESALTELKNIADYFLLSDRPIINSIDDSVYDQNGTPIRSSRGLRPAIYPAPASNILCMGADMKNAICITNNKRLFISPYHGNLSNFDCSKHLQRSLKSYQKLLEAKPKKIAYDLHPNYESHQLAIQLGEQTHTTTHAFQHHKSHISACMWEHSLSKCLGVCFDGTGLGDDKQLWGGDFFLMDLPNQITERVAFFRPSVLLGNEKAILEPYRQIISRMLESQKVMPDFLRDEPMLTLWDHRHRFMKTTSVGRLFDAVSALIMPQYRQITYDGQAAMALQTLASKSQTHDLYQMDLAAGDKVIDSRILFTQVLDDFLREKPVEDIAKKFHLSIAKITVDTLRHYSKKHQIRNICFSGGVFHNKILTDAIKNFADSDLILHWHQLLPCGDENIAVGQYYLNQFLGKN